MQKEINVLRMQLANKSEELDQAKLSKVIEVDRAREEGYNRCETRMVLSMRSQETKYKGEIDTL
jgi:hypothetical protein